MSAVRPAAVAGTFFPADAQVLRDTLAAHLADVPTTEGGGRLPKLLVVPHAGYIYSGAVAALAYAPLARWRGLITRVVLLGPSHRVAVRGLVAPTVGAFETPLGRVVVDEASLDSLADLRQVVRADRPHAQEHALEVQLPFLQTVLGPDFQLVPLTVGQASPGEVAEVLERLWGGEETLIVVSSDLSHFLPYEQAQVSDRETVRRIMQFATDLRGDEACGAAPLNGALLVAHRHGLTPRLLGLRNSGDTEHGDRQRVVGYGAVVFDTAPLPAPSDDDALGRELVAQARRAIADALARQPYAAPAADQHPALQRRGATFVTLHDAQGRLRGCVGRLEATRPLGVDVRANARAAAFEDSRFPPLRASEWPGLRVEVSLLETPEPMAVGDEAAALAALRPGVDGVILQWHGTRATLLPQVWEQCPQPSQFMAALKRKAGLPADFWSSDVRLSRYRVRSYTDSGAQPLAAGRTA
jgi:AmmeMemoRadiSam system protein B/AmmeMemoRadiSam system protein A